MNQAPTKPVIKKATKNIPLTHAEVKALPVLKDEKGRPIASNVPEFPNNAERRMEKRPVKKGGNRKNTRGRHVQYVDITVIKETPFGMINAPTGFIRKLNHSIETRVRAFVGKVNRKIFELRNRKDETNDVAIQKKTD